jgi:hypothetical protein
LKFPFSGPKLVHCKKPKNIKAWIVRKYLFCLAVEEESPDYDEDTSMETGECQESCWYNLGYR